MGKKACLPDWLVVVIALLLAPGVRAGNPPAPSDKRTDDGSIQLDAADAKIVGSNARLEGTGRKDVVWWTSANTSLQWTANIQKPGKYRVELCYSLFGNTNGSPLTITVGEQKIDATPKAGNGVEDFKIGSAGELTLTKTGKLTVSISPQAKLQEYVINIRSLALRPADAPTQAVDISGAVKQLADGSFKLIPDDVQIDGANAQLIETENGGKKIGFWHDIGTSLSWAIDVQKPGKFRVELDYALISSEQGSRLEVSVGGQKLKIRPKPGKSWTDYKTGGAGEVTVDNSGKVRVVITPVSKPHAFILDFRSLSLVPAKNASKAVDISDKPIEQAANGSLTLNAVQAEIDGDAGRLEGGDNKYLAWWNSHERLIRWPVKVGKPGVFHVEMNYAMVVGESNEVTVSMAGQTVAGTLSSGNGLDDFKTGKLGDISIEKAGDTELSLESPKEVGTLVMHLQSIALVPVDKAH